jgi:hypothetical protein
MFTDFLSELGSADENVGAVVVLVSFYSKRCAVGQGLGITANRSADGSRLCRGRCRQRSEQQPLLHQNDLFRDRIKPEIYKNIWYSSPL